MINNSSEKKQLIARTPLTYIDISKVVGPVYIVPVSCVGIVTYHALRKQGIEVSGFCDNDLTKVGKSYDGCSAYSPEEAVEKNPEATFVIASVLHHKELSRQFKNLGMANVLYVKQFLNKDIFDAALDDVDESAAKALTGLEDPKTVAIRHSEIFWMKGLTQNSKPGLIYFSVGPYNNPFEAFKQWFDKMYVKYDSFASITISMLGLTAINHMTDMVLYLKKHLKKPTKFIKLSFYYSDRREQLLRDLEERLLKEDVSLINFKQIDPAKLDFRVVNVPVVVDKEDAYSDIEDKLNCIFVHIPKTAGTSINAMLSGTGSHHKRALSCKLYDPKRFEKYFKFSIIRNPWDRLVSQYCFACKEVNFHRLNQVNCDTAKSDDPIYGYKTFRDYVLSRKGLSVPPHHHWICDDDGNILVDYIGRFENLPETIEYIKEKLGLDPTISLPHVNATKHKPYTEYYDEEMIEIVREAAKHDIELFGYEFGKDPGPNIIINPRDDFVPVNRRG